MQTSETTGHKCTKCGKSEADGITFFKRMNSYGKYFQRELCSECYAKRRRSLREAVRKKYGPGECHSLIQKNRPPDGTLCPICDTPMTQAKGPKAMNFDHDHSTDTFRGYICMKCNTALGGLGDNLEGLCRAINYLTNNTNVTN